MSIGVFGVAGVSSCLPFTEKGLNAAPLLHKVTSQCCCTALKGAVSEGGEAPCCVLEFALSPECHRSLLEIIVRQMAQFYAIHMAGFRVPYFCLEYLSMNGFNESFRSVVSYSIVLEAFVLILPIGLYAITVFYCRIVYMMQARVNQISKVGFS